MEYIKGPWEVAARIFVDDAFGNTVCVPQAESPEGREARARLIAAAPDLLEALKAWENLFLSDFAISLTTRRPMTNADQDEVDGVLILARAAIAKAEKPNV